MRQKLPESLKDAWVEEIRALGLEPEDNLPEKYKTGEWYKGLII